MNPTTRVTFKKLLKDEQGQMAIFIALIFQVLFVFFAMVINIGLIVHDKINLQNAVDLGAYYAAQRQAEMLNEIAHINYQIRQDYKLLTWRIRVLGAFGRDAHPIRSPSPQNDEPYIDNPAEPLVCVAHNAWQESVERSQQQNLCRLDFNVNTPPPVIPEVKVIFDAPYNNVIKGIVDKMRGLATFGCEESGAFNYLFASQILYAFRESQRVRKEMIKSLAANVSNPQETFFDQQLNLVKQGVEETVRKNLTPENERTLEGVELLNGLSLAPCSTPTGYGVPNWLSEIHIVPLLYYTNLVKAGGGGCRPFRADRRELPAGAQHLAVLDPTGILQQNMMGEPPTTSAYHAARGFEKNPWCLAYVGVKAKTRPRKPFSPFGQGVEMEARAFAQPFGGRIGPWDGKKWDPGAMNSSGDPVDPLAVPRKLPDGAVPPNSVTHVPNYSRFPGDTLGLTSRLSLWASRDLFFGKAVTNFLSYYFYDHFGRIREIGDVLAWDSRTNQPPPIRDVEAAAIAPDIFDITYYSVEPSYFSNYFSTGALQPRFTTLKPISDLGSRLDVDGHKQYQVRDQINIANLAGMKREAYYVVRKSEHLLTGWQQNGSVNFDFPFSKFGQCTLRPGRDVPNPGDCVQGGRTGYSVRLIARDYLFHDGHQLGGANQSRAPILNKPPADF